MLPQIFYLINKYWLPLGWFAIIIGMFTLFADLAAAVHEPVYMIGTGTRAVIVLILAARVFYKTEQNMNNQ